MERQAAAVEKNGETVQNLAEYGTQFYFSIRNHALDPASGNDIDDVLSTLAGARVKF